MIFESYVLVYQAGYMFFWRDNSNTLHQIPTLLVRNPTIWETCWTFNFGPWEFKIYLANRPTIFIF